MHGFDALPPEVNSARIYAGPGPGPLLAAAAAWDAVAAQLESFASAYSGTVSELHGQSWSGAASAAMASAAAPYVAWASTTSATAEQAAGQARAATAAYEGAFAATVPPAVVAANRATLAVLVATNVLGQNTPAIAAAEASYAEMWAQDAAAMYGYAASASAAAQLASFSGPPPTTNAAAQPAQQAAASQAAGATDSQSLLTHLMSAVPQLLQNLASGGLTNASHAEPSATVSATTSSGSSATSLVSAVGTVNALDGPLNIVYQVPYTAFSAGTYYNGLTQSKIQAKDLPKIVEEDAAPSTTATTSEVVPDGVRGPVVATTDEARSIAVVSVPQSWTSAMAEVAPEGAPASASAPAFRALPPWTTNPAAPGAATPAATPAAMPGAAQLPNGPGRSGGNTVIRMRDRRYRIPRPALGG